jgi:4-hydroxy-3-methylbut-2-enyl diphosphate reductase IspH
MRYFTRIELCQRPQLRKWKGYAAGDVDDALKLLNLAEARMIAEVPIRMLAVHSNHTIHNLNKRGTSRDATATRNAWNLNE